MTTARLAGHLLIESLIDHGTEICFGVPGESYLAALDGLYQHRDRIRFIACRQEGGAANMAEAYGKLTGRPGVCFVTRGPGATNASIGVHTAFQDSTPMVLFVGQVERGIRDREGFQEVDYRAMFTPLAKWVAQIDSADRIPEYVARAYQTATSGRQGPVVLALPEDMLLDMTEAEPLAPYRRNLSWPDPQRMEALAEELKRASKPLMLVGGGGWTPLACQQLEAFARQWNLPVACAFRFQDTFDNCHPNYVGEVGSSISADLRKRIEDADLILAVGVRLGEGTTRSYTLVKPPRPAQRLVHVHAGAEELGRVYQADVMVQSSLPGFCASLGSLRPPESPAWQEWTRAAVLAYEKHASPPPGNGLKLDLAHVAATLQQRVPDDTIYASGAGNFAGWFLRFIKYRGLSRGQRTQLEPSSGAMGYGVPAAVGARLVEPHRTVVSISGDGCFMMNGQELATAAHYGAKILFLVVNNGSFGTIRMHQEMYFPDRISGTDLTNPDFSTLASAYGMKGFVVEKTEEFEQALANALAAPGSALIELRTDVDVISARTTLSEIRRQAKATAK
ncbi:thiamine pyrophosphate-binding protein [Bordetella genomosp. 10]|uniref:Thiamine pyrophosphate-binding protein n=1 Tax=Bordetella genomosp. 10 TaxID=1416804 RepID=A0A261S4K5_9BORD|nr:thiamine pyrophosphate-binding protein [Bordetella genomosp. 10]OZI32085.1 thiamine pyrophosphate-binding protein [Bordetella genomosp. 10]